MSIKLQRLESELLETLQNNEIPEILQLCLMYQKGPTVIFKALLPTDEIKLIKGVSPGGYIPGEFILGDYLYQRARDIPHIVHLETMFIAGRPEVLMKKYPLLRDPTCINLNTIPNSYSNYVYGVYELCLTSLSKYIGQNYLMINQFIGFCFQIIIGFYILEHLGIMHRDIKPQNIVVCEMEQRYDYLIYQYKGNYWTLDPNLLGYKYIKIIDFGEAILLDNVDHCKFFNPDPRHICQFIINLLWKRIIADDRTVDNERMFMGLCKRLVECKEESLMDILLTEEIFGKIRINIVSKNINLQIRTINLDI